MRSSARNCANGAEQAAADINARGGVLGQKFIIVPFDDRGDLKQGISIANHLVNEKIFFVVGHFYSSITLAVSEIYANHSILEITPSATNPQITERGLDLIFRTCGRDDQQSAVAAKYLAAQTGKKNRNPVRQYSLWQRTRGRCPAAACQSRCSGCALRGHRQRQQGLRTACRTHQGGGNRFGLLGRRRCGRRSSPQGNARGGRNGAAFRQRFPWHRTNSREPGTLSRRRADDPSPPIRAAARKQRA